MPELTLATLNLFNNAHGRWPERVPLVTAQLLDLMPDVVTLQEVQARTDQIPLLVEALNGAAGDDAYAAVTMPNPKGESIKSLAVLTHLPMAGVSMVDDLPRGDIALHVALDLDAGHRVHVFTTHLHYGPSREGGQIRQAQVARLRPWVEAEAAGEPLVLAGDFNATPDGRTIGFVKQRLRSAHAAVHGVEPSWTHPTELVHTLDPQLVFGVDELPRVHGQAIDYVFVNEAVEVLDARVAFDIPSEYEPELFPSDHLGLVTRLRV